MSMVAKILIFVNLVLAVMVMGAAGAYLQSAEDYKGKFEKEKQAHDADNKTLQERADQASKVADDANRKAAAAVADRAQFEAANRTLEANNTALQKQVATTTATLQSIDAKTGDLQKNLDSARQANEALQKEKEQADAEKRSALEAKAAAETEQKRLENENANLKGSLDAAEKNKVAMADQIEALDTKVKLYVEKYGSVTGTGAIVNGMVLAADSKTGVYLISVGKADVKAGDELTVFRGDSFVAQVVVDRVLGDDKASVYVKMLGGKKQQKADIMQGDKVKTIN
jgi:septal ring factor EnvC (AmiA/AmiB activator)